MKNNKKPGEPLETERRAKMKHGIFIEAKSVFLEYQSIRRILGSIQVVQIIQSAALVLIAVKLLST